MSFLLYREISAEGKSNCRVNGMPATAAMLREVSGWADQYPRPTRQPKPYKPRKAPGPAGYLCPEPGRIHRLSAGVKSLSR